MAILTTKTGLTDSQIAADDVFHIVDVTNTTDDPSGSSFKVRLEDVMEWIEYTLGTFGGNGGAINENQVAAGDGRLVPVSDGTSESTTFLRKDGTWATPAASSFTGSNLGAGVDVFKSIVGLDYQFRTLISSTSEIGYTENTNDLDLTISWNNMRLFDGAQTGLVPISGVGAAKFFRGDGTWQTISSVAQDGVNLGGGTTLFTALDGSDNLQFKSIQSGHSLLVLTNNATEVTVTAKETVTQSAVINSAPLDYILDETAIDEVVTPATMAGLMKRVTLHINDSVLSGAATIGGSAITAGIQLLTLAKESYAIIPLGAAVVIDVAAGGTGPTWATSTELQIINNPLAYAKDNILYSMYTNDPAGTANENLNGLAGAVATGFVLKPAGTRLNVTDAPATGVDYGTQSLDSRRARVPAINGGGIAVKIGANSTTGTSAATLTVTMWYMELPLTY